MRLSAALLVVLLAVSAAGVSAGYPAATGVGPPADAGHAADRASAPPTASPGPTTASPSPRAVTDASGVGALDPTNETAPNATASDGTEMFVSLRENGDARWNVSFRFALHDRNQTEAFRRLADRYRNGNTDVGYTPETFRHVVDLASTDTDREMELRRVNRSARLLDDGSVGVLSLSFTWTNFTQTEAAGSDIDLGDVFWANGETWLPTLSDDQTLVIAGPDGYYISGASPSGGTINGTVLKYEGPQRFDRGDFSLTYSPKVTETTNDTTDATESDWLPVSDASGILLVVLLFGFSFGVYALTQRRSTNPDAVEQGDDSADAAPPPRAGDEDSAVTDADAPTGEEDADGEDEDDEEEDGPATELLSDEERVLRLLRENDGRMKQAQIVKETNWSNAKVSQLLSKMDDEGEVDKLRIGRENLITLPDEDVTDTG